MEKLTAADKKFLTAHIDPLIFTTTMHSHEELHTVSNPFTGETIETTPQIATLVKMIQDLSYDNFSPRALKKWGCKPTNCISKFDRARYIVMKLDRNVYLKVVD